MHTVSKLRVQTFEGVFFSYRLDTNYKPQLRCFLYEQVEVSFEKSLNLYAWNKFSRIQILTFVVFPFSEHTNALNILDSLLQGYDRRATPTNHLGIFFSLSMAVASLYLYRLGCIHEWGSFNSRTIYYWGSFQVELILIEFYDVLPLSQNFNTTISPGCHWDILWACSIVKPDLDSLIHGESAPCSNKSWYNNSF